MSHHTWHEACKLWWGPPMHASKHMLHTDASCLHGSVLTWSLTRPTAHSLHALHLNPAPQHALQPGDAGYDPSTLHIPAAALAAMSDFNKQVSLKLHN